MLADTYRPIVRHRTGEVVMLSVKVACPAGWWMPLHSDKRYWDTTRKWQPKLYKLPRLDNVAELGIK